MKKSGLLLTLAAILLLSQTACEKKTVNPKPTHWDAVKSIISQNPGIFQLGFFDTQSNTLFYREMTESDADIEHGILVEQDTGQAGPEPFFPYITLTWGDTLKGKFHYRWGGSWREKAFKSIALTNGLFERWGDNSDPDLGWILQKFSGTVISSVPTTMHPSILYVTSSGVDDTITEPRLLALVKKTDILIFGEGQLVTFTVEPASDTSDFLFLHIDEGEGYLKIPFLNNGDETLSASWTTTGVPDPTRRYYHAIVDIVSRESVTDTLAEYNSKAWGIIYKIQ